MDPIAINRTCKETRIDVGRGVGSDGANVDVAPVRHALDLEAVLVTGIISPRQTQASSLGFHGPSRGNR